MTTRHASWVRFVAIAVPFLIAAISPYVADYIRPWLGALLVETSLLTLASLLLVRIISSGSGLFMATFTILAAMIVEFLLAAGVQPPPCDNIIVSVFFASLLLPRVLSHEALWVLGIFAFAPLVARTVLVAKRERRAWLAAAVLFSFGLISYLLLRILIAPGTFCPAF